jgi:hypothetical protein
MHDDNDFTLATVLHEAAINLRHAAQLHHVAAMHHADIARELARVATVSVLPTIWPSMRRRRLATHSIVIDAARHWQTSAADDDDRRRISVMLDTYDHVSRMAHDADTAAWFDASDAMHYYDGMMHTQSNGAVPAARLRRDALAATLRDVRDNAERMRSALSVLSNRAERALAVIDAGAPHDDVLIELDHVLHVWPKDAHERLVSSVEDAQSTAASARPC